MSAQLSRRSLVLATGGTALGAAALATSAGAAEAASFRTLRVGMTGSDVLKLQQALAASSFWCGTPDGSFGPATQQAVWALQKAYAYPRYGYVDYGTWTRAMSRRVTLARYTSSTSNGVEIDLKRQLLLIVRGGKVKYTLNTSTGSGQRFQYPNGNWATAITPRGTFRIFRKSYNEGSSGWVTGPLGSMYKPRFFTSDGIAIHGSTSIPAYPASHGCCRLSVGAQNMLLANNLIPIGNTTVRIY